MRLNMKEIDKEKMKDIFKKPLKENHIKTIEKNGEKYKVEWWPCYVGSVGPEQYHWGYWVELYKWTNRKTCEGTIIEPKKWVHQNKIRFLTKRRTLEYVNSL